MKAWLVTWVWADGRDQEVVSILSPRWGSKKIRELVEIFHVNSEYSLRERLEYATNKKWGNPYQSEFIRVHGVPHQAEIHCGHNPFLFARKVKDIKIVEDKSGKERIRWEEIPFKMPSRP